MNSASPDPVPEDDSPPRLDWLTGTNDVPMERDPGSPRPALVPVRRAAAPDPEAPRAEAPGSWQRAQDLQSSGDPWQAPEPGEEQELEDASSGFGEPGEHGPGPGGLAEGQDLPGFIDPRREFSSNRWGTSATPAPAPAPASGGGIPMPLLLGVVAVVAIVAIARLVIPHGGTSIGRMHKHPGQFDGHAVTVHGKVADVFSVAGGYAFYLTQGRDTLMIFSRKTSPVPRQQITVSGQVSTGFLDGRPRLVLFEKEN